MTPQRIGGLIILVLGVVLLVMGMNSSHSIVDQASNTFTGRYTDSTMWYIIGGIVLGSFGLLLAVLGLGKNSSK